MPMSVTFENAAELVQRLGNIPLERICFTPPPGTATERDLLTALRRSDRLYELVDGTLGGENDGTQRIDDRPAGFDRDRRICAERTISASPPARTARCGCSKGLVRIPDVSFFCWDKLPGRVLPSRPIPDLFPDLAVEVLSEKNTREEMERKSARILSRRRPTRLDDRPTQTHCRGLHLTRRSRRHSR